MFMKALICQYDSLWCQVLEVFKCLRNSCLNNRAVYTMLYLIIGHFEAEILGSS